MANNLGSNIRIYRKNKGFTQEELAGMLGVTPQAVVMASKPDFCITHSPGHMFITDVKNVNLKY